MQHAYGGGSVGEGHRYEDVSKTVTQQPRPSLEREISAGQKAKRQPRDRTGLAAGAGLATAAVGAGLSGSGQRRIKRVDGAVNQAASRSADAGSRAQEARSNAHLAERGRAQALTSHQTAKQRQAELSRWERSNRKIPHTTRVTSTNGNERPTTVSQVPSSQHATVRNALNRQAHDTAARAKELEHTEHAELGRASAAAQEKSSYDRLHERGLKVQRKVVPRMKARIGAGRGLMIGGGLAAGAALVNGERKRSSVGKSLEGVPLSEISKTIGFGNFRGEANTLRATLARRGKNPEVAARIAAAKKNPLGVRSGLLKPNGDATTPARRSPAAVQSALGKPQGQGVLARMKAATRTPDSVRASLSAPNGTELSNRLNAAGGRRPFGKAHLGGGVYKPITELGSKELSRLKSRAASGKRLGPRPGVSPKHQRIAEAMAQRPPVHTVSDEMMPVGAAATLRYGGKKTGRSVVINPNAPAQGRAHFQAHEGAHADPKRSAWRLHGQVMQSPKKLMREEARADYTAQGHYGKQTGFGSLYSSAARAERQLQRRGPKAVYHDNLNRQQMKETKQAFKEAGHNKVPTASTKRVARGYRTAIQGVLPHYDLAGKKGRKAVSAYADLQDDFKRRGLRPGTEGIKPKTGRGTKGLSF